MKNIIKLSYLICCILVCLLGMARAYAEDSVTIDVPVGRSIVISLPEVMSKASVANAHIASVSKHGGKKATIHGKSIGSTTVKFLAASGEVVETAKVRVVHDMPDLRRTLSNLFPEEHIGVEVLHNSYALTGEVSSADVAAKAVKVTEEYIKKGPYADLHKVINLMKIKSSQQVMLRVRVGEINRTSLKEIGLGLNGSRTAGRYNGSFTTGLATGVGVPVTTTTSTDTTVSVLESITGLGILSYAGRHLDITGVLNALEEDGLFKVLAEPNLVAISGETAKFLAGGEFPIPIPQGNQVMSVEYKPFGVSVEFTPYVLSGHKVRLKVEPEVSEINNNQTVTASGFSMPSLTSRRASTTVELAPGESFMIAGLIKDDFSTQVKEIPGLADLPILGALVRSTAFNRNETELVIAVTPYLVDPVVSSDIKLPTDNFHNPSVLETVFFGSLSGKSMSEGGVLLQSGNIEQPMGFMVE